VLQKLKKNVLQKLSCIEIVTLLSIDFHALEQNVNKEQQLQYISLFSQSTPVPTSSILSCHPYGRIWNLRVVLSSPHEWILFNIKANKAQVNKIDWKTNIKYPASCFIHSNSFQFHVCFGDAHYILFTLNESRYVE
jgi:hypothetical protein